MTLLPILIALFSISLAGLAALMLWPTKKYRETYRCRTTVAHGNETKIYGG
jgi:hypothetical protein